MGRCPTVSFSRGAAQAREFASFIMAATQDGWYRYFAPQNGQQVQRCQRVDFRFMNLFDTVLSINYSGGAYNLAIPDAFAYVAHAVALNEYRSGVLINVDQRNPLPGFQHWGGFQLESIGPSDNADGRVRLEMGFLGAHADISGDYPEGQNQPLPGGPELDGGAGADCRRDDETRRRATRSRPGDARQEQRPAAGRPRRTDVYEQKEDPAIPVTPPPITMVVAEDCNVKGATAGNAQRTMQFDSGSMTNADTHQFISYLPRDIDAPLDSPLNPKNMGEITATVDIAGYLQWLREHGYTLPD